MKKTIIAILLTFAGFTLFADSYAFTYQACLRDDKGEVIKEGGQVKKNLTVQIRLYKTQSGGTALWGRAYSVLTDENGLFNLAITDTAGSSIDGVPTATLESVLKGNQPGSIFLGLTVVGSSGEIVPRQCIYATPFAAVANDVRAVSGDLTIGGNLTFGSGSEKVVISKSGVTQEGGSATFQELAVNGSAAIEGSLSAGGGVLKADGSGVTVTDHPLNVVKTQLQIDGSDVVPVPVGGIIMWTKAQLPDTTHWSVCDGSNGTPDLRARFIVGVGSGYSLNDRGGKNSVALTVDEMPPHKHDYIFTGADLVASWVDHNNFYCHANHYKENVATNTTESVGSGVAHENRPPYYALYYIMRIK